jgi:hypothetical protein
MLPATNASVAEAEELAFLDVKGAMDKMVALGLMSQVLRAAVSEVEALDASLRRDLPGGGDLDEPTSPYSVGTHRAPLSMFSVSTSTLDATDALNSFAVSGGESLLGRPAHQAQPVCRIIILPNLCTGLLLVLIQCHAGGMIGPGRRLLASSAVYRMRMRRMLIRRVEKAAGGTLSSRTCTSALAATATLTSTPSQVDPDTVGNAAEVLSSAGMVASLTDLFGGALNIAVAVAAQLFHSLEFEIRLAHRDVNIRCTHRRSFVQSLHESRNGSTHRNQCATCVPCLRLDS